MTPEEIKKVGTLIIVLILLIVGTDCLYYFNEDMFWGSGLDKSIEYESQGKWISNIFWLIFVLVSMIFCFLMGFIVFWSLHQSATPTTTPTQSNNTIFGITDKRPFMTLVYRYTVFFLGGAISLLGLIHLIKMIGKVSGLYSIVPTLLLSLLMSLVGVNLFDVLIKGSWFTLSLTNIYENGIPLTLLFYLFMTPLLWYYNPWNLILPNTAVIISVIILTLAHLLSLFIVDETSGSSITAVKYSALFIMGIILSVGLILALYTGFQQLVYWFSSQIGGGDGGISSWVSLATSIGIIVAGLGLLSNWLIKKDWFDSMPSPIRLVIYSLLYIPCLLNEGLEIITRKKERVPLIWTGVLSLLLVIYFSVPFVQRAFLLQSGHSWLNEPVNLNKETALATYQDLNALEKYNSKSHFMGGLGGDCQTSKGKIPKSDEPVFLQPFSKYAGTGAGASSFPSEKKEQTNSGVSSVFSNLYNTLTSPPEAEKTGNLCGKKYPHNLVNNQFNYQYALSGWFFVDADPPSTKTSYNEFVSILNFGTKPQILFRAGTHTLRIVVPFNHKDENQNREKEKDENKKAKKDVDENGNRIVYESTNFEFQKWNHLLVQQRGGTLDVFLNGELVASANEVVPFMKYDVLTVGSRNGINGGVCNVLFFRRPLMQHQIQWMYSANKRSSPPILPSSWPFSWKSY